jgi:hypothetical protein
MQLQVACDTAAKGNAAALLHLATVLLNVVPADSHYAVHTFDSLQDRLASPPLRQQTRDLAWIRPSSDSEGRQV